MNLYGFFNIHYVEFLFLNIMFNSNMLKINKKRFCSKGEHHEGHLSYAEVSLKNQKKYWNGQKNAEEVQAAIHKDF